MKSQTQTSENPSIDHLKLILADTFVLYMKTYAVHWNYQGPKFFSIHKMTEQQYEELAKAIDEIAERIRACDGSAPVSLHDILGSADLNEMTRNKSASGDDGVFDLVKGHMMLARRAKEAVTVMDKENDPYSADMMTARVGHHEKAAWMLKSILPNPEARG